MVDYGKVALSEEKECGTELFNHFPKEILQVNKDDMSGDSDVLVNVNAWNSCRFDLTKQAVSSRIVRDSLIWYEDGTLMLWEQRSGSKDLLPLVKDDDI